MGKGNERKDEGEGKQRTEVNTIKDTIERLKELAEVSELGEDTPFAFPIEDKIYEMGALGLAHLLPIGKDKYTEETQWTSDYKPEDADKTQPVIVVW